jgi:hypothetical protein
VSLCSPSSTSPSPLPRSGWTSLCSKVKQSLSVSHLLSPKRVLKRADRPSPIAGDCPWTTLALALLGAGWLGSYALSFTRMLIDLARPGIPVRSVFRGDVALEADAFLPTAQEVRSEAGSMGRYVGVI